MPVDIKKFLSTQAKVGGVAKPSHFAVEIGYGGLKSQDSEMMTFLCESANLPGIRLGTDDTYAPHGYGMIQKMPWNVLFDGTLNLSFMGDNKGFVLQILHSMLNKVIPFNDPNPNARSTDGRQHFMMSYPSEYMHKMNVWTYDPKGQKVVLFTFHNCYLCAIGNISFSAGDTGYQRIPVSFNYTHMTTQFFTANQLNADNGNQSVGSSFLNNLIPMDNPIVAGIFNRVQQAAGIRVDQAVNDVLNNIQQQVPPELQNVYARAIPLLGGIGDFRF